MKLKWHQAPVKTQWGDNMVVSSIAIDNDHTVDLYCERDQAPKVEAMFAQRTWIGLTDDEIELLEELYAPPVHPDFVDDADHCFSLIKKIEAKLKEKNT
jgi:hypothetical protein